MDSHCFASGEKNGASFRESSEEEIVAINEAAFFYPSDLLNTKTTIPPPQGRSRAVNISLDASRLGIYPPLFTSPSGDTCIVYTTQVNSAFGPR